MSNKIDLHGKDRNSAQTELKRFISGNYNAGYRHLEVVFGIGSGTLKRVVRDTLNQSKIVEKFEHPGFPLYNLGSYNVVLKKKK